MQRYQGTATPVWPIDDFPILTRSLFRATALDVLGSEKYAQVKGTWGNRTMNDIVTRSLLLRPQKQKTLKKGPRQEGRVIVLGEV